MIKFNKIINFITIVLLLVLPYYLFEGKLYIGGDDTRLLYSYPFEYLKNFIFFTWTNNSSIGINQASQFLVPFLSIWSILGALIGNKIILSYLAFSLPLVFGFIYFKKFVKELFNLDDTSDFQLLIGSFCFILSPIIIFDQLFIFLTTVWLLGVIPAVGYYYLRYLKTAKFIYIYVSVIICIIFSIALFSVPWILGFVLPTLIGSIVLLVLGGRSQILLVLKRSVTFFSIIIFSQSFWLIGFLAPHLIHDNNSFANRIASQGFIDTFAPTVLATAKGYIIYPLLNLFHRQIAFDFGWQLKTQFINLYDKTFFLNLIFIFTVIIGLLSYKKYFNKRNRIIYLFIFTSLILSLYFFTVNIGLLKDLFLLFGKIPGFVMFRNFYDKFAPGYIILYSILITSGFVLVKKRFPSKYKLYNLIIFLIILLNFSTVKSTVNTPLWTTNNIYKTINIPSEYLNFMNKINKEVSSTNSILSIPFGASLYTVIKDAHSENVYVGTSPVKIFSEVNDISGDMSFNFTKETDIVSKLIINRKYNELNKMIFNHNINYILVTKNIPNQVLKSYIFYSEVLKKEDKRFIDAITSKKVLTSENGNYELYTAKKRNNLLQSNNLYFQKINSVKYVLYLKNIKKPQELQFNDSFHNDWKLFLQHNPNLNFCFKKVNQSNNTTECKSKFSFFNPNELLYMFTKSVFDSSHTSIDSSSNVWTIDSEFIKNNFDKNYYTVNKDGSVNIELVLYFREQLYFYYGIMISFIVMILLTGYLIVTLHKKNEKNK